MITYSSDNNKTKAEPRRGVVLERSFLMKRSNFREQVLASFDCDAGKLVGIAEITKCYVKTLEKES